MLRTISKREDAERKEGRRMSEGARLGYGDKRSLSSLSCGKERAQATEGASERGNDRRSESWRYEISRHGIPSPSQRQRKRQKLDKNTRYPRPCEEPD